jgi:hypothetical protein
VPVQHFFLKSRDHDGEFVSQQRDLPDGLRDTRWQTEAAGGPEEGPCGPAGEIRQSSRPRPGWQLGIKQELASHGEPACTTNVQDRMRARLGQRRLESRDSWLRVNCVAGFAAFVSQESAFPGPARRPLPASMAEGDIQCSCARTGMPGGWEKLSGGEQRASL